MTAERILVIGKGIEAWLFAGVTARLLRGLRTVELAPAASLETDEIALPPSIHAAHRLLGIGVEALGQIGRPRYGVTVQGPGGDVAVPYGRYGDPLRSDFIGQWLRLRNLGAALPLAFHSANAALMAGARLRADSDRAVAQSVVTGWQVDPSAYRALLEQAALGHAVRRLAPLAEITSAPHGIAGVTLADGTYLTADLVVDASSTGVVDVAAGWHGNAVRVGSAAQPFAGPEAFGITATLSAAARLVNLLPRDAAMPILAAEYRRLFEAEREVMIAADAALLRIGDHGGMAVVSLLRHHDDSYRTAGSLPRDGQPWHPDQWLSCFEAVGLVPVRHDPNADRVDPAAAARDLSRWASRVAESVVKV